MRFLYIFSFLLSNFVYSNYSLTQFPKNYQLYKRNVTTNLSEVKVSGVINRSSNFNSLNLDVYKNNVLINSHLFQLYYNQDIANFNFSVNINSELSVYKFILKSNDGVILKTSSNIVSGDVYVINGQSNAEFHNYYPNDFPENNSFIRTYFNSSWTTDTNVVNFGGIGYWFAKEIVVNQNIPVAIFNEAASGRPIEFFQKNAHPPLYSSVSNYASLINRIKSAGYERGDIRAIVWYQGESDRIKSISKYTSYFKSLYQDWEADYNPEKYYVFQIRKGCSSYKTQITEAQRILPIVLPKIRVISTNGVQMGSDNCHYFNTNGYNILAKRLHKLVAYDLYNSLNNTGIFSPDVSNLHFSTLSNNQIKFELTPTNDNYTLDSGIESDFFLSNSNVTISSASISGNIVTLDLSDSIQNDVDVKLNYYGRCPDNNPKISNQNGIGMLSFNNLTIYPFLDTNFSSIIDNGWTYYYNNSDSTTPIFAIQKFPTGGNTVNFSIQELSISNLGDVFSKTDTNTGSGLFILSKYWNLNIGTEMPNGIVNIRFFYDLTLKTNLESAANNFAIANNSNIYGTIFNIQSDSYLNPQFQTNFNGFFGLRIKKCGTQSNYGSYSGYSYFQMDNVIIDSQYFSGTLASKVEKSHVFDAGTIRFNKNTSKFEGFNGNIWVIMN